MKQRIIKYLLFDGSLIVSSIIGYLLYWVTIIFLSKIGMNIHEGDIINAVFLFLYLLISFFTCHFYFSKILLHTDKSASIKYSFLVITISGLISVVSGTILELLLTQNTIYFYPIVYFITSNFIWEKLSVKSDENLS